MIRLVRAALRLPVLLSLLMLPLAAHAMTLEALNAQLAETQTLAGDFVQERYLKDLDTTLTSSGRFDYVRGERVHWHLLKPIEDDLILDQQGMRRDGHPIDGSPAGVAELILQLMDGNLRVLEDRFRITLEGDKAAWQALLIPRQAGLADYLDAVRLGGGQRLERVQMDMHNGDRLTVTLHADPGSADAGAH